MIKRALVVLAVISSFFVQIVAGQDRQPRSFAYDELSAVQIPTKTLPPIPRMLKSASASSRSPRLLKSLEFGSTIATSINLNTESRLDTVGSTVISRIMIKSEGAKCLVIKLNLDRANGFDSQNIFVYTPSRSYVASTLAKITDQPSLVLPAVPGECAVVEVSRPIGSPAQLSVSEVVHGDRLPFKSSYSDDLSGSCNVDIACAQGQEWQLEKNSIVKIAISTPSGIRLCSGVLINNTARNKKPYLLTANHCIYNQQEAQNAVFYFGHERKECGAGTIVQGKTVSGGTLLASGFESQLDFSLVELSADPPAETIPFFAGWDVSKNPFTKPGATCLHHPNGDVKKISIDYDTPTVGTYADVDPSASFTPNTHWHVAQWDVGTTEGGSSGAALFNASHLVVGNLTGGSAECGSPVDDYFSAINAAWDSNPNPKFQLKYWLDPMKTGESTLGGLSNKAIYTDNIDPKMVSVYPVPVTNGTVHIRIMPSQESAITFLNGTLTVNLYDLNGRLAGTNTYTQPAEVFDFVLPTRFNGLYFLEIASKNHRVVKKIIVINQ